MTLLFSSISIQTRKKALLRYSNSSVVDIQRNQDGIAVIPVKDDQKTVCALVSDVDYHALMKNIWCILKVDAGPWNGEKFMEDHILLYNRSIAEIEHVNGNMLDNRRDNLRLSVRGWSSALKEKSSKYAGVRWHPIQQWAAEIWMDGKYQVLLGFFDHEEDAAEAYRRAFQLRLDIDARRRQV